MSALIKFAGTLLATLTTAAVTVMCTATSAFAKHPLPENSGDSVKPLAPSPIGPAAESGLSGWYILAIVVGIVLVITTAVLAVAHHRLGHPRRHGPAAA